MKRIAIISDTHNHLPDDVLAHLEGCDAIIHAGDICEPSILWQLEAIAPVTAVLGNNDYLDFGPSVNPTVTRMFDGVRFVVAHEPPTLARALANSDLKDAEIPTVAVHGHTHVPALTKGETGSSFDLKICPGSLFRSREEMGRRTYAIVEVDDGEILGAKIMSLAGEVLFSI